MLKANSPFSILDMVDLATPNLSANSSWERFSAFLKSRILLAIAILLSRYSVLFILDAHLMSSTEISYFYIISPLKCLPKGN